jgi:indolepyruvate ferredoxin oxidoreductase beta subunit
MVEIVICGRGGQGVVFLTRQIGQIISDKGLDVISSETHGMAVRGGSINSHLRIGEFFSPLTRHGHADFLLSLDKGETANNLHFLKPCGLIIENSTLPDESGIKRIDAAGKARKIGRVQLENIVLLAFASKFEGFPVSSDDLRRQIGKEPREIVRRMNIEALDLGIGRAI